MPSIQTGDMARPYQLQAQNSAMKARIDRLSAELASGRRADPAATLGGDLSLVAGFDRSLAALAAYDHVSAEAGNFVGALQIALDTLSGITSDLAPSLNAAATSAGAADLALVSGDARQRLFAAVAAINGRSGDRYVLSGAATDRPPLAGAQAILDGAMAAATGQVTGAGVVAAVEAWFDAPLGGGGFVDSAYGGSAQPLAAFRVAEGVAADFGTTATDPALRETLKGLTLAALAAEGALPGDRLGQAVVMRRAGALAAGATTSLAYLQADIGGTENRIAAAATRNGAERAALEIARTALLAADPFETASRLEEARTQLETLYAITARMSGLSLADYL